MQTKCRSSGATVISFCAVWPTVTMWMPLVDAMPEMGTLRFATGSHRELYLGDLPIRSESLSRR